MDPAPDPGYLCGVFGLGFGEMVVLGIVLLVVAGPRELPKMLRSLGQGIRKLRRMSTDLREQSGIDEILEDEGLREDLETLRSLRRGRMLDGVADIGAPQQPSRAATRARMAIKPLEQLGEPEGERPDPEQERPIVGVDCYGALPDDASEEALAAARARAAEERPTGDEPASAAPGDADDARGAPADERGDAADARGDAAAESASEPTTAEAAAEADAVGSAR